MRKYCFAPLDLYINFVLNVALMSISEIFRLAKVKRYYLTQKDIRNIGGGNFLIYENFNF